MAAIRPFLPLLLLSLIAGPVSASVPFPSCEEAGCSNPASFSSYLFLPPGRLPNDFDPAAGGSWKYNPGTGMDVVGAWGISTGRPDVVVAVLDSGIRWNAVDVARKVALNAAELPIPAGCSAKDCNGDGFVGLDDYASCPDHNGNNLLDGQDLIREYSDGIDDDGNGYVDDIAGWDFFQDDNDPDDDVDYGHGTGEAEDSTAEADNGGGLPGVAPNALFLPLRVGDSFVAIGSDFAQAVVYATDRRVALVQEALGAVTASPSSQGAIDYAYRRGIPVMASAADEESRHHNLPAALEHTIWLNSIVEGDGTLVEQEDVFDLLNGCTNYGGRAWVSVSSNACSSEATGRGAGLAALLVSHGRNLIDRGLLEPYPGLEAPFSAEEIRQLFRRSADDVDHEDDLEDISMLSLVSVLLSGMTDALAFGSRRFPTQAGWDQFTGYGRPDAVRLLDVRADEIPPEADLSGSLRWFDRIDPVATPQVEVRGSAAAIRSGGSFDWRLEVGCGVQPKSWMPVGEGSSGERLERAVLGSWAAAETAQACGFDPAAVLEEPDAHSVSLRLQVVDRLGNQGEDRRTVAIHRDPGLRFPALDLGSSLESSPVLADLDRNGVLDLIVAASDGHIHALRGDTGAPLPGFPARTLPLPIHPSPGYESGEVPVPHEAVVGAPAADDLDGDGRVEIVVASVEGRLYVFDDHGRLRPGFPVGSDPDRSQSSERDPLNDADPGLVGAPTLVDLDRAGAPAGLEIVVTSLDGHAFRHDGRSVSGFPVRVADRSRVSLDSATGRASPISEGVRERATKIIGSAAVGDLDGDGRPELVVSSNEEYREALEPGGRLFALSSNLLRQANELADQLGGTLSFDVASRLYAVRPDGDAHPDGPFLPGWPVALPILQPQLLPTVGTGAPGSPTLADLSGEGELTVAGFSAAGPAMLFGPDGTPRFATPRGLPRALALDFPGNFPDVPASAGSADAPFFPALGTGAFGDITGDGLPEYVSPTAGLRKLLDVAGPAEQAFGDHQVSAWNPRDGSLLPAFPRVMDDTQFLTGPALADVDGDGQAEVLAASGVYLVRAYRADGSVPEGFPKFTHGWSIATPTPGDVDGDGLIEVVIGTREGNLFVWDTPAPASDAAIPWQGFGGDRRNTQNASSGVSRTAAPLVPAAALGWALEALRLDHQARTDAAEGELKRQLRNSLAPYRLGLAVSLLEAGAVDRAAAMLSQVDRDLRRTPALRRELRDLRQRLAAAVASALRPVLATATASTPDEERNLRLARSLAALGDDLGERGSIGLSLRFWARALVLAAPLAG